MEALQGIIARLTIFLDRILDEFSIVTSTTVGNGTCSQDVMNASTTECGETFIDTLGSLFSALSDFITAMLMGFSVNTP